jgi:hypothetical protein
MMATRAATSAYIAALNPPLAGATMDGTMEMPPPGEPDGG